MITSLMKNMYIKYIKNFDLLPNPFVKQNPYVYASENKSPGQLLLKVNCSPSCRTEVLVKPCTVGSLSHSFIRNDLSLLYLRWITIGSVFPTHVFNLYVYLVTHSSIIFFTFIVIFFRENSVIKDRLASGWDDFTQHLLSESDTQLAWGNPMFLLL